MHMTGMGAFSPPTETPAPPKRDGRNLRSERTRRLMINQTREFMKTGHLRPTSQEIATAADVSARSIFQHFDTMGDLYSAALEDEELAKSIAGPARLLNNRDLARAIVLGSVVSDR